MRALIALALLSFAATAAIAGGYGGPRPMSGPRLRTGLPRQPGYQEGRVLDIRFSKLAVDLVDTYDVFLFNGAPVDYPAAAYQAAVQAARPPAGGLSPDARAVLEGDERDELGAAPGPDPAVLSALAVALKPTCFGCHSGDKPKGGFKLFLDSSTLARNVDWPEVHKRVTAADATQMPPAPRPRLAAGVLDQVRLAAKK